MAKIDEKAAPFLANIPPWVSKLASTLVGLAERTIGTGPKRKEWAKSVLRQALRAHDMEFIPDAIEEKLEDYIADVIIERTWALLFKRQARRKFLSIGKGAKE